MTESETEPDSELHEYSSDPVREPYDRSEDVDEDSLPRVQSGEIRFEGEKALYIHDPGREISETKIVSTQYVDPEDKR